MYKKITAPQINSVSTQIVPCTHKKSSSGLTSGSYEGQLTRLGKLACLGKMIFIPRTYGMFYLGSIEKFVMSLEKDRMIK